MSNQTTEILGGEMTETPRRTITKTPLKTVNAKAKTSPTPPVERQKKERKPLYVAPPAKGFLKVFIQKISFRISKTNF